MFHFSQQAVIFNRRFLTLSSIKPYNSVHAHTLNTVIMSCKLTETRMWANAQRDGRPAEHRWRPLFNATKFGRRPLLDAVQ